MKGGANGDLDMASLSFAIKAGGSIGNVELFGMKRDTILTFSRDMERMEIPWDEREELDTIARVDNRRKHLVKLTEDAEAKEFISDYEAALYIADQLKELDKIPFDERPEIKVTGTVEKEPYIDKKGNKGFSDRYIIRNVVVPKDKEKTGLKINMELFYNKASVDKSDFKSTKRIVIDGYVNQYIKNKPSVVKAMGEANDNYFMPQRVVLSAEKLDPKNEKHQGLLKIRTNELNVASDKKLYHMFWECALISGAEEVEFDESQLTEKQKEMIELGIKTIDDYKPLGNIYGPKVKEIRLINPLFNGEFENGVVEAETTMKELEKETVKFLEPESFEEIAKAATSKKSEVKADEVPFDLDDDEDDGFDLFGDE